MFRVLAITAMELEEIHPQLNLTSQLIDWDQYLYHEDLEKRGGCGVGAHGRLTELRVSTE